MIIKKILNVSKIAIAIVLVAIVLKGRCPAVDPLDHTVLLPNPDDCSSYFMCSNGVPILQKCPEGLHFNARLNVCDWPQNAGCGGSGGFFGDDMYYNYVHTEGGGGIPVISVLEGDTLPGGTITTGPLTVTDVTYYGVPIWAYEEIKTLKTNMFAPDWHSPLPCQFKKLKPARLNETADCTTKSLI